MNNKNPSLLDLQVIAVNLGLKQFADSLESQEVEVVHVQWTPPADGDEEMIDLLEKLL